MSLAVVAATSILLLVLPSLGMRLAASVMFSVWLASLCLVGVALYVQYVKRPAENVGGDEESPPPAIATPPQAPPTPQRPAPPPPRPAAAPPPKQAPPASRREAPAPAEASIDLSGYEIPGAGESIISPGEKITLVVRAQPSANERYVRVTAQAAGEPPIVERAPVSQTGEARVTLQFPRQGVFKVNAGFENGTGAVLKESVVRVVDYREAIIRLYHGFRRHALRLNSDLSPHLTARELAETLAQRGQGTLQDLVAIVDLSEKALYSGSPVLRTDYLHLIGVLKRLRATDVLEGTA
ncbi:MAG: hypothetical protein HY556_00910 [Euryarchaeota archaeon]|nr:hypothetical protein [Euryarchaeota archaeon]